MSTVTKRILLIDDMPDIRESLRRTLCPPVTAQARLQALMNGTPINSAKPYDIFEASQGEDGVALARQAFDEGMPFDIAIVDMRMPPGIDGLETIRRIREFDNTMRVVVCSGFSDYSVDELTEINGGAAPIIVPKPFEEDDILAAVKD